MFSYHVPIPVLILVFLYLYWHRFSKGTFLLLLFCDVSTFAHLLFSIVLFLLSNGTFHIFIILCYYNTKASNNSRISDFIYISCLCLSFRKRKVLFWYRKLKQFIKSKSSSVFKQMSKKTWTKTFFLFPLIY